jgi:hypothetical protein
MAHYNARPQDNLNAEWEQFLATDVVRAMKCRGFGVQDLYV